MVFPMGYTSKPMVKTMERLRAPLAFRFAGAAPAWDKDGDELDHQTATSVKITLYIGFYTMYLCKKNMHDITII